MKAALGIFLVLLACSLPSSVFARDQFTESASNRKQSQDKNVSFVFASVSQEIAKRSHVPSRVPTFLPDVDQEHPIYATVENISESSYEILLSLELPCEGQNTCSYGAVRGSTSPIKVRKDLRRTPVQLLRGIKGEFFHFVCYAYCSESYIVWRQDNFFYSISLKAGSKDDLIKAANSAIATDGLMTKGQSNHP